MGLLNKNRFSGGIPPHTHLSSDIQGITDIITLQVAAAIVSGATYTAGAGIGISTNVISITDVELLAIAGLTSAADRLPYFTGSGTASLATFTAAGRALVDDATADIQLATLGGIAPTGTGAVVREGSPTLSGTVTCAALTTTGEFISGASVKAGASGSFFWAGKNLISAPSDGIILCRNAAASALAVVQFKAVTHAGAVVDGDFSITPPDGAFGIDTTNHKHYIRTGGTWKASAAYS